MRSHTQLFYFSYFFPLKIHLKSSISEDQPLNILFPYRIAIYEVSFFFSFLFSFFFLSLFFYSNETSKSIHGFAQLGCNRIPTGGIFSSLLERESRAVASFVCRFDAEEKERRLTAPALTFPAAACACHLGVQSSSHGRVNEGFL